MTEPVINDRTPECPCGMPATTRVRVDWVTSPRVYAYCAECAEDITTYTEGTTVIG